MHPTLGAWPARLPELPDRQASSPFDFNFSSAVAPVLRCVADYAKQHDDDCLSEDEDYDVGWPQAVPTASTDVIGSLRRIEAFVRAYVVHLEAWHDDADRAGDEPRANELARRVVWADHAHLNIRAALGRLRAEGRWGEPAAEMLQRAARHLGAPPPRC